MQASGFGAALRDKRLAAGLTQEELAEQATVSARTISNLERGFSRPYSKTLNLLAGALGLTGAERDEFRRAAGPAPSPDLAPPAHAGGPDPAVPQQLPPTPADFTGRAAELKTLADLLDEGGPGQMAIAAISGTAGVGKTALAVYWAHHVAARFPDGQLYVNLRGYDPDQPMAPGDALAGFLRALGVPGQDIPADLEERAARYRSLLARRRMVIVLDNAGSVAQVRPLLPGAKTGAVVVTSRDTLAGLVARDGARRLDLDLLSPAEADVLLARLIGERARADPRATAALAAACARLPLALRVAAELAVSRPAASVADLVAELSDRQQRLDLLEAGGDPRTAVRTVFSWSCQHLDADTARAFRMLGLHPGPDLEPYAVAALTGGTLVQARRRLDQLARAHLIQSAGASRYSLHDLLRAYARELAAQDGEDESRAALTRLFDHYLHTAAAAMDTLYLSHAHRHRRPRVPPSATPTPAVTRPATARAWLDEQRATLVAVTAHGADHGWASHGIRLAATIYDYLDIGGHLAEAMSVHTCAYRAARGTGDRAAEASALTDICGVHLRQGRYRQAAGQLRRAAALCRETGDGKGEARALGNLGLAESQFGRLDGAIGHLERALTLYRQLGDPARGARALNNLGFLESRRGCHEVAVGHFRQALELSRRDRDQAAETHTLVNLGRTRREQGRYEEAIASLQQALELARRTGNAAGEAFALSSLAAVDRRQGRYEQAADRDRQALALCRASGDRSGEAEALNGLGELFLMTGRPRQAATQHSAAIRVAGRTGDKEEQARALNGLGHASQALADPGRARQHWQQALTLYSDLGMPEAAQVREQLAVLDGPPSRDGQSR